VTDNPQPEKVPGSGDLDQIKTYQRLVLEYEALDEEIDSLLARHRGSTEHMSDEDYEHYRELARHRDDLHNRIKALEREILLDDDTSS